MFFSKFHGRSVLAPIALPLLLLLFFAVGCVPLESSDTGTTESADASSADAATADAEPLVIYSGRSENLVGPLIEMYREGTEREVEVRYGGTAEMASVILEEGDNSPADVFFGQDAGALGALADAGRCNELPAELLERVDSRFVSPAGVWVGASARARVLVYNTEELSEDQLPASVFDLTDETWRGRIGWAPTNASFQAFVTALRVLEGEDVARQWLEDMLANDVQSYSNNTSIVEATGAGEISAGLVNHYYLYRFLAEDADYPAANYYFPGGDPGSMVNVAGACAVNTGNADAALDFITFLLSDEAQAYFVEETHEYPLVEGMDVDPRLTPLSEIEAPEIDLSNIDDLQGTLSLLAEVGALE